MKQIIISIFVLQLISCNTTSNYLAEDELTITDEVGRVKGYIKPDGTITDSVGRVTGYIE